MLLIMCRRGCIYMRQLGQGEVHICKESTVSHNGSAFQVNFVEGGQAFCPKSPDPFPSSRVGSGDKTSIHQAIANHVISPEAKEHASCTTCVRVHVNKTIIQNIVTVVDKQS